MESTIERIQRESKERQRLWHKSGEHGLKPSEVKLVQSITTDLANLWHVYRSEFASRDSVANRY